MKNLLLLMAFLLVAATAHSQNADSIHTLSKLEIKDGRFLTEDDLVKVLKFYEKSVAFDSTVAAKENESRDLVNIAMRMQHNLDLQNRLNDDFRKQIADKENMNVNCEKEKQIIIKSERKDKLRKAIVTFLIGFAIGGIATTVHF